MPIFLFPFNNYINSCTNGLNCCVFFPHILKATLPPPIQLILPPPISVQPGDEHRPAGAISQ